MSEWTVSLFSPSATTFVESCFCPCLVHGKLVNRRIKHSDPHPTTCWNWYRGILCCLCSFTILACPAQLSSERSSVRLEYEIEAENCTGDPCFNDLAVSTCCYSCALAQEYEQVLSGKGFDFKEPGEDAI